MIDITKSPYNYFLATRLRGRHILKLLEPKTGELVFDIGSGIGYFAQLISNNGAEVIGFDLDLESAHFSQKNSKGEFLVADIRNISAKDNSFDKILCTEVLEHLQDETGALKEIYRVSKNGAKVVITTPCSEGLLNHTPLRLLGHKEDGIEHHYRVGYKMKELCELLEKNSIRVVKAKYCTGIFSEAVVQLSKLGYYMKKKEFNRQVDFNKFKDSFLFKVYKYVFFPFILGFGILEDAILSKFIPGHILVLEGVVDKEVLK